MKQVEKLDLLLKELYKNRATRQYLEIDEIFKNHAISVSENDIDLMEDRLLDLGLITKPRTKDSFGVKITSKGIEYCEEDSFSSNGKSIITNNYISNSPGSNIINNSSEINIDTKINDIDNIIKKILCEIKEDNEIEKAQKQEILECIREIELNLDNKNIPKFGIKNLLGMLSNISSVSDLVIQLVQFV